MEFSAVLSSQRCVSDLIIAMEQHLPKYLGFEGLGILLVDTVKGGLFNIRTDTYTDEEKALMKLVARKRANKEVLTKEERLKDLKR